MFADLPTIREAQSSGERETAAQAPSPPPAPPPVEMGRLEKQSQEFQCTLPWKKPEPSTPQKHTFS